MTDSRRQPAQDQPDYEQLADNLPEHVIRAVADAVSPQEIGATNSAISELVHRVMVVTYQATAAAPSRAVSPMEMELLKAAKTWCAARRVPGSVDPALLPRLDGAYGRVLIEADLNGSAV